MFRNSRWVVLFASCLLFASLASAQTQARLTGTVNDNTGAVIIGATVTLSNVNTGVAQSSATNESGIYNFPIVAAGRYELSCEFAGFKTYSQTGIAMETGFARSIDIEMEVGDVTETVEVLASTPLLETENSTVGQFIERDTVFNMPLASRRSASLVRLMGMSPTAAKAGRKRCRSSPWPEAVRATRCGRSMAP